MRRSKKSREMDEIFARLDAEDRAVEYLGNFPSKVALATALTVEWSLATRWAAEQREMWRRSDPREVVHITYGDFERLIGALTAIPPGIYSDVVAEQYIIDLLAGFPADRAWWIAHQVADCAASFDRSEWFRDRKWAQPKQILEGGPR